MSFEAAFNALGTSLGGVEKRLLNGLPEAMLRFGQIRGTFPTPLKLVDSIRSLASTDKATPEAVADLVFQDPLLSLRLISLVNRSFYRRGYDITDLTAAVNHIGLMKVADVLCDLANARSLKAFYLGRSVSALAYQRMLFAIDLSLRIVRLIAPNDHLEQQTELIAALGHIGPVMLAYQAPNLYAACALSAGIDVTLSTEKQFRKVVGKPAGEFGSDLARSLGLPPFIVQSANIIDTAPWNRRLWDADRAREQRMMSLATYIGASLTEHIFDFKTLHDFIPAIRDAAGRMSISPKQLESALGAGITRFFARSEALGSPLVRLPGWLVTYADAVVERDGSISGRDFKWPGLAERINSFINELRACFRIKHTADEYFHLPQAMYCTLRALVQGLSFDAAVFFKLEEETRRLLPVLSFGGDAGMCFGVRRDLAIEDRQYMPDAQAIEQKKPIFYGDPIFGENYPFVAFPVMRLDRVIGVFYAHKNASTITQPLDLQEQVAATALAEEWRDVPIDFA